MRILFFLLPVIALQNLSTHSSIHFLPEIKKDTVGIVHLLDGNTSEWPVKKFNTDNETAISYAVDNDNQTLFLALKISDKTIQSKILHQGMDLYLDTKGKKKEERGVEFPVKIENSSNLTNNLDYMKLFGFTDLKPFVQNIKVQGTVNIAVTWDSTSGLNIEYNIPLNLLEKSITDLNNKSISLGWKIKNAEITDKKNTAQATRVETTLVGKSANGDIPAKQNAGLNKGPDPFPKPDSNKTQSFWTTHTIVFQ